MKAPPPTERQDTILRLLRERDEAGMRQLFEHYAGALLTIIRPIVDRPEVADEVLQDVLLKVWNNVDRYDAGKSRFFTWMARIARNQAIDRTRSKAFRQSNKTAELSGLVSNSEAVSVTPSVDHIGVGGLLNQLDDNHRRIIELLYLRDYTQSEVAKELDIPLGTIKTRSRRAILQLREHLGNEMIWLALFSLLTNLLFTQF